MEGLLYLGGPRSVLLGLSLCFRISFGEALMVANCFHFSENTSHSFFPRIWNASQGSCHLCAGVVLVFSEWF